MATIRFNLKATQENRPQTIRATLRHNGKRIYFYTPFKVMPKYWNTNKGRVKNTNNVPEKNQINQYLNDIERVFNQYLTTKKANNQYFSLADIKKILDVHTGKTQEMPKTLIGYVQNLIDKAPERINPNTGKVLSYRTVQKYKTTFSVFRNFCKHKGREYDFKDIDLEFYEDFSEYLKGLNYATNTIGKHIQTFKVFLNSATETGVNKNLSFKSRRFKVVSEQSENIYLNETELKQLEALDLSGSPHLENARDLFLVGCWTGLRFSDLSRLTNDNIRGEFIHIEQQKTGNNVLIPLHGVVKNILHKYGNRPPRMISNQRFNEYIKEVCRLAGIDTPEHKAMTKGGIRQSIKYKKYELVTTHTARRSFATNLYKSGFPSTSIMQITGHKTERAFLKYIKVTPEEHAKMLQMHWANTGQHLRIAK